MSHVRGPWDASEARRCPHLRKGRHVAEVARALEQRYAPFKMNYLHLGNGVPHLHVHLVPRHADDPRPGAARLVNPQVYTAVD